MKPVLLGKYASAYRPPTHDVFSVGSIGYEQEQAKQHASDNVFNKKNLATAGAAGAAGYGTNKLLAATGMHGKFRAPVAIGAGLYAGYKARKAMGGE